MIKKKFAFSGGGIRGIAYIGCLRALENRGLLDYTKISKISGTSIGSLFAVMLCVGFTASEMQEEVLNIDFTTFQDISFSRFVINYGLDSGLKFIEWISKLLHKKTGNDNITFLELYKKTRITLIITGTCLNTRKVKYFNYLNTPHLKIKHAIRISTSIPLLYTSVKYKNEFYVDGGILDNYPLHILYDEVGNGNKNGNENKNGDRYENCIIGFRLTMEKDQHIHREITSLDSYLWNLISCILESSEDKYKKNDKITVKIDTSGISNSLQFGLSKEQKINLIKLGYKECFKYITTNIIDSLD